MNEISCRAHLVSAVPAARFIRFVSAVTDCVKCTLSSVIADFRLKKQENEFDEKLDQERKTFKKELDEWKQRFAKTRLRESHNNFQRSLRLLCTHVQMHGPHGTKREH